MRSTRLIPMAFPLLLFILVVAGSGPAASSSAEAVDFASEIWPVLERSCLDCHGGKDTFSNLVVTSPEALLKGGDLGKVIVPGKPDESPLLTRTELPMDDLDYMPVEGEGLSEEETAALRQWIADGADFGDWTGTE